VVVCGCKGVWKDTVREVEYRGVEYGVVEDGASEGWAHGSLWHSQGTRYGGNG
jgi:hypothetical protein